ncbi:MAG: MBL fold metallo-hydrolase [Candidatus Thorarchaeota archaeon]|jgi:glyoxylase-like metal-dependent hydrolase (beta-lactamase superfamily II)
MIHPGVGNPEVQEISPGVFVITKLVHFFAEIGVNAGFIKTPTSVIFIDSGMSAHSGKYLWDLAHEQMSGSEDLYLIITHKDTDHHFGMNEIKKHGATVIAHKHSSEVMYEARDLSKHPIAKRIRKKFKDVDALGDSVVSEADQVISEDAILDLGEEIRILSVPGHTPGDIAVYHPRSKILFAGDAILEGMDPYIRPDSININTWINNLERMKDLEIEWICPGHGRLSRPGLIDKNIEYLKKNQ